MDKTIDYNEFPARFPHCFNEKCPLNQKCLHYLINKITPTSQKTLTCINPAYLASQTEGECPYFLSSTPQKYGKGITHLFDRVPYPIAINIREKMIRTFGRTNYYRFNRKERLISPHEQELIRQFFKEELLSEEPQFDQYVDYFDLT